MTLETRLRNTNFPPGGGGGGSSNSGGLAGTGAYFVVASANTALPNSYVPQAGTNVQFAFSGSNFTISATTGAGASNSAGLAGTGPFYLLQTSGNSTLPFSKLIAAGSSITTATDATSFYINATTATPIAYAPSGSYFVVGSAQPLLPGSRILAAGSSVTIITDGTSIYITAVTNTFAGSGGLASSGNYYIVGSAQPLLPGSRILTAGSSVVVRTDATAIYIDAITSGAASNSGGLAGTGPYYILQSGNAALPNSQVLTAGSSVTVRTSGGLIYIDATTGASAAATNVGTGGFLQLPVQAAKLYASTSAARIDAGTPAWRLLYSATTQQFGVWQFTLPFDYSGNPATQLIFSSDSSLSVAKSVNWLVDQWAYGNSQSSIYVDTFAGTNSVSIALSAGYSAGLVQIITVPLATTNSFAAGNLIKLRVSSSAGNVTGNQELVGLGLYYRAGTQTIATGSAGLAGTATIVRTLTDITVGRAFNTTYTNSGATVINSVMGMVVGRCVITLLAGSAFFQAFADTAGVPTTPASGIVGIESGLASEDNSFQLCFVASPGVNYRVNSLANNGTVTLSKWFEFNL